jgi:hypothetical protein
MYDYKSQLNQMLPHSGRRDDDKTGEKIADEPKIVQADIVAELKRERDQILEDNKVLRDLSQRRLEYQQVRQNMVSALREMLITHFNFDIQIQYVEPTQVPVCYEGNPAKISDRVRKWFSYSQPDSDQHCDFNARFCWATFLGDKDLAWVHKASCNDASFSICSVETLRDVRNDWLQSNESAMIVRFISATDMTDGHTIFSCKNGGKVWTFQAYLNGCSLQLREYDIFNVTDVIKKITNGEHVTPTDFGLDTVYLNPTTYNADRCMYLKQ